MDLNKKSQGLPLSFIVIAAISVLILVVIVFMVTGTGGKVAGTITGAQESDVGTASSLCQSLCQQVQMSTTYAQYKSSGFCTNKFRIDTGTGKVNVNCWGSEINQKCTTQIGAATCEGNGVALPNKCECYYSGCHAKKDWGAGHDAHCHTHTDSTTCTGTHSESGAPSPTSAYCWWNPAVALY